jgi:uncharacterized repeat protein (TIGR03803 family)
MKFLASRQFMKSKMFCMLSMGIIVVAFGTIAAEAQTYTESIVHNFPLSPSGFYPHPGSLVMDSAGNFYGTALAGGTCCGALFKLSASGVFSNIYNLKSSDGFNPCCLVIDKAGNLYGTTLGGSTGGGTVFKFVTKTNSFSTLHTLNGSTEGRNPEGPLTLGPDGSLYGSASNGGTNNQGVLFKISLSGKETVLYQFTGGSPAFLDFDNVLVNRKGDVYLMLSYCCLVQITAKGVETTLASPGDSNVYFAGGALARNGDGNFYGYFFGNPGAIYPYGMWEVNGSTFAVSYYGPFTGYLTGLPLLSGGNLYSVASTGGLHNEGSVYVFDTATGEQTNLYDFGASSTDGSTPEHGVVKDAAGNLYGTTDVGGTYGYGTIFKLTKE